MAVAGPQLEGACSAEYVAVNFWPRGHRSLGKNFSKYLKPHAEASRLVKYGTSFVPSGLIAFADAYGRINLYPPCERRPETTNLTAVYAPRTVTMKANATCSIPNGAYIRVEQLGGRRGPTRRVVIDPPRTAVLTARFAPKGSTLTYSPRAASASHPSSSDARVFSSTWLY